MSNTKMQHVPCKTCNIRTQHAFNPVSDKCSLCFDKERKATMINLNKYDIVMTVCLVVLALSFSFMFSGVIWRVLG